MNILFLSCGRSVYFLKNFFYWKKKKKKKLKIVTADNTELPAYLNFTDKNYLVSNTKNPKYLKKIIDIIKKEKIDFIIPFNDFDIKFIFPSTSEVYGTANFVPITEKHPLQGQSPYSASKIGADQIAMSFYTSFGTPVSIIRPFNTYGPRQSTRAVIPTIITQIAGGQRKIKLGALHPTRDFNYIEDTISGFIEIAKSEATIGEVINIGNNYEISIGNTANLIAEIMSVDIDFETETDRLRPEKSEVFRLRCDNSKAKNLINWQPKYSGNKGLKEGLRKTIEWFTVKEHLQHYKTGYTL